MALPVAASPLAAPSAGPAWLDDHRFLLPRDGEPGGSAEARHRRALADPARRLEHRVRWSILRAVQAEDEQRLQRGLKKRMRKLTTAKHINRTSYSALKVDIAVHVLSKDVADQIRLRRYGGWMENDDEDVALKAGSGPDPRETEGVEAYIRIFARTWELLGDGSQPAFWTGDESKDLRIRELQDILRWFQMWHEYSASAKALAHLEKPERSARGLTYQLYYDTHSLIDAVLRMLRHLDSRGRPYRILARRLCQDSLESLFGRMRQAGGGQRDLSVKAFVDGLDKQEEKGRRKAKRVHALEQRRNCGARGEDD